MRRRLTSVRVRNVSILGHWKFAVIAFARFKEGLEKSRIQALPSCQSLVSRPEKFKTKRRPAFRFFHESWREKLM